MTVRITISGQELELLGSDELSIVHAHTKPVDTWILDTFFPNKVSFDGKDAVPIDELETSQPLAPFVSPVVQGKVIETKGSFEREYIKAPYVKPAKNITPANTYDLALLSLLQNKGIISKGTKLTTAEQFLMAQIMGYNELVQSIKNRKTLMACDILMTGKTIAVGDDYGAQEINFNRHTDLAFTPLIKWNEANATIASDLETMNERLIERGGVGASVIVTSSKVFNKMVKNEEFKERFIAPKGSTAPNPYNLGFADPLKVKYRGEIDGIAIYTYDATHKLDGTTKRFINDKGLYMISDTSGFQAQCEIKHLDVLGSALEFYQYQVVEKDPSSLKMICESSPLIIPSNVNGVCGGDAFIT